MSSFPVPMDTIHRQMVEFSSLVGLVLGLGLSLVSDAQVQETQLNLTLILTLTLLTLLNPTKCNCNITTMKLLVFDKEVSTPSSLTSSHG